MNEESVIVSRDQCPRCKANGKDNSRDNLAIYSDGHEWCYSCGYHVPARLEKRIATLNTIIDQGNKAPKILELPSDASVNLPVDVHSRLRSWGLTEEDIIKHNIRWSEVRQTIVYPIYDAYGQLIMYQERNWVGWKTPKYLTFGNPSDILHILYPQGHKEDNSCIILTEDLISAIRVSKSFPAMPLWGNQIPLQTIRRLASRFQTIGVWLDPDMKLKAVKDVIRISQYVPAFFIESSLDPKFYNDERIKEHIAIAGYDLIFKDEMAKVVTNKE